MMKKWPWAIALFALLFAGCIVYVPDRDYSNPRDASYDRYDYGPEIDEGYFYDYLSPYGTWIRYPQYGYVWIPRNMGYRWRPYTHGHWVWTDYGWTWISDYDWGWACFHYGRWGYDDAFGWFWVPGSVWGPAWVSWRTGDLYFGWAPIPPWAEWRAGYGFGGPFDIPDDYWIFCENRNFLRPGLYNYALPFERNRTIVRITELHQTIRFRDNNVINDGIDRDVVRRVTREMITPHRLVDAGRPGEGRVSGGEVRVYRPNVKASPSAQPKKFIERDKADETITRGRIYEPERTARGGAAAGSDEAVVQQRQEEEKKILERTHEEEERVLNRRYEEKNRAAKEQTEREKIKKEQDSQAQELRKRQDEEKARMQERQKRDAETVKRNVETRKTEVKKKK